METITSDPWVIQTITGVNIEFTSKPFQVIAPCENTFSTAESEAIDLEVQKLLQKGVISKTPHEPGEFISQIFIRPKKDGTYRLILNLKKLNQFVKYHHFKMETIHTATELMKQNCYMASIDLRDAYYSVPVCTDHQKYLKFSWRNILYKFTCLPNGLASAPRIFTKLLKPVYATLRSHGHVSFGYIDDSYLQGDSVEECQTNVDNSVELFEHLGFTTHDKKSVLLPTQQLILLGFILNSVDMTISLTPERVLKLKTACIKLMGKQNPSIQEVAHVVGLMVASFPGNSFGQLFYRSLDTLKTEALRTSKGSFKAKVSLPSHVQSDLQWWVDNIEHIHRPISHGAPCYIMQSDASTLGWGAHLQGQRTGGQWTEEEAKAHINCLELKAAFLALQSFSTTISGTHVRLELDNTTAVSYINCMGGSHSKECNSLARQIWLWCIDNNIWVSAAHIPGSKNVEADRESRVFHDNTEWALSPDIFQCVCGKMFLPQIDLFASRLNHKVQSYVAWRPDPKAVAVDAFTISWTNLSFYAFPPFSLITRVLQKIRDDSAEGLMVVPLWETQVWFPLLMKMLVAHPLILPQGRNLLYLPYKTEQVHPLHKKLQLVACHLSGNHYKTLVFQSQQPTLLSTPGGVALKNSIKHTSKDGFVSVVNGKLIQFHQL